MNRSVNHEMYPQEVCNNTLSSSEDKRCYGNNVESSPWE